MPVSNLKMQKVFGVDGLGHADVVGHAHEEGGHILFEGAFGNAEEGNDYILIDASDTTNYPHDNTNWMHLSNLTIDIAPASNVDYILEIGFIENLTTLVGDYYPIYRFASDNKGEPIHQVIATNPENVKGRAISNTATGILLADAGFGSTDPSTGDTRNLASAITFGEADIVLRILTLSGNAEITVGIVYHSH